MFVPQRCAGCWALKSPSALYVFAPRERFKGKTPRGGILGAFQSRQGGQLSAPMCMSFRPAGSSNWLTGVRNVRVSNRAAARIHRPARRDVRQAGSGHPVRLRPEHPRQGRRSAPPPKLPSPSRTIFRAVLPRNTAYMGASTKQNPASYRSKLTGLVELIFPVDFSLVVPLAKPTAEREIRSFLF